MSKSGSGKKKYITIFWAVIAGIIVFPLLLVFSASMGWLGEMPSVEDLVNPKSNLATEVFSADGKVIGKYYKENRTNISYDEISPYVINALIATEDARFYTHSGVDIRGLVRALFSVGRRGGASTISQQLAKMLFHGSRPSGKIERLAQKIKEWVIAAQLERHYTKEELIAMYLNRFDFINNAVGIKSAARIYFNTTADKLTVEQAAMLVGMCKNPSYYNPNSPKRFEVSQLRRNVVLHQMSRFDNPFTGEKFLSKSEFDSLKQIPLKLDFRKEGHNEGLATYFRESLRAELTKWCEENKKPDGTKYNIYRDGLKIYTTIDSRMQQYAEEAVAEHLGKELQDEFFKHWKGKKSAPFFMLSDEEIKKLMEQAMTRSDRYKDLKENNVSKDSILKNFNTPAEMTIFSWKGEIDTIMTPMDSIRYYKHFLQTGFMSMDPHTGHIKAWVGGINYKHFKYDHVKQSKRQVGSTFKPFVYALAMQEYWSPCTELPNVRVNFDLPEGGVWSPENSDGEYGGMLNLKKALAGSVNTITAQLMKQFGPQAVIDLTSKMGISGPIEAVPSICLGTPDVSVYEMVGANSTFANKGVWTEPIFITRIEDKNGNILQEFIPKRNEVMSEEAAFLTLNLMQGVVESGTGMRLRFRYKLNTPIAGKTGTTQKNSDGWFMGITPDLVSGVWVGCSDRSAHFRSTHLGQGANMALPIWGKYMQKVYADPSIQISKGEFERPENPIEVELDCNKFKSGANNSGKHKFDF